MRAWQLLAGRAGVSAIILLSAKVLIGLGILAAGLFYVKRTSQAARAYALLSMAGLI